MSPLSFLASETSHIMKGGDSMILFMILIVLAVIAVFIFTLVLLIVGGSMGLVLIDITVCVLLIYGIIKFISHI